MNPFFLCFFFLVVAAIGFGVFMMVTLRRHWKEKAGVELMQRQYPTAPWKWRRDWASGKIESEDAPFLIWRWILGLWWISISASFKWLISKALPDNLFVVLLLLVSVPGVVILTSAAKQTLLRKIFGTSHLELAETPVIVGG